MSIESRNSTDISADSVMANTVVHHGATGATGPSATLEYAYIYHIGPQTVLAGDQVRFNNNGIMTAGIAHLNPLGTISIGVAGTYDISFSTTCVTPVNNVALFVNETEVPGSSYSNSITYDTGFFMYQNSGQCLIVFAADDVLTLQNIQDTAQVLYSPISSAVVNASITIKQIS